MPRFLLKVLTADIAKRWHSRFCATAMIAAKCRGMVIAINQREALLVASCYECWFHTPLRCVADGCWIQKSLGLVTPVAMSVPTTKIESHDSVFQSLTVINRKTAPVVLLRFWDEAVPFSGRVRIPKNVSSQVAKTMRNLTVVVAVTQCANVINSAIGRSFASLRMTVQRGSRNNASAPLPVRRFISTNEPPCASAI